METPQGPTHLLVNGSSIFPDIIGVETSRRKFLGETDVCSIRIPKCIKNGTANMNPDLKRTASLALKMDGWVR